MGAMDWLQNLFHALSNVLHSISILDFIDIALLTYIVYALLKFIRETRAGQLMKGIALLVIVFFLSSLLHLRALHYLMLKALNAGVIAFIILFQPELRRALERFGQTTTRLSRMTLGTPEETIERWNKAIPVICDAADNLSKTCTGALIVIEGSTKLGEQILNGTVMKAEPTVELFGNIFYPKTPLHDGAVIMRDGIIWAAACFLPKPQSEELIDKHLGSRHRAAIGMSENSDALVIVVSEETGQISCAQSGEIIRDYTRETLETRLRDYLFPPQELWKQKTLLLPIQKVREAARQRKAERKGGGKS